MWEVSEGGGGVMGRMMLNCNLYQTYKFAYGAFYHFTIYVSSSVPDGAPVGITVTNISSHALLIEWSPPDIPNGVITAYTIYINYNNRTSVAERVVDGSTLNYTLDYLSPHQLVSVQMTANTSVGEGPRSIIADGRTDPTGIKLQ